MTTKTTQRSRKANSSFDMAVIRRRAKAEVKKRYGKTIKLSTVDKVWKDYVEYAIIRQVLYRGIAEIENHFSVTLTGKPYSKQLLDLIGKGYNVGKFGLKKAEKWNRLGTIYKLKFIDKNCKGQIIFEAHPKFKKLVFEKLKDTTEYFKIEK